MSRGAVDDGAIYAGNWEYLLDELGRLDLRVRLEALKHGRQPQQLWEQFKGLVLSEEEIAGLLAGGAGPSGEGRPACHEDDQVRGLVEALTKLQSQIQQRRSASLEAGVYLTLPRLAQLFHLNPFEEQCLIICLAPELDRRYEKLYAYLQDDVTCKRPGVDLALKLLFNNAEDRIGGRIFFEPRSPLIRYRLLHLAPDSMNQQATLLSRWLKLDDGIVNFLLGFTQMDARLDRVAGLVFPQHRPDPEARMASIHVGLCGRIREHACFHLNREGSGKSPLFYFYGPHGAGRRTAAEAVCGRLGIPLIVADIQRMLDNELSFGDLAWLLGREAMLQPAALCLDNFDLLVGNDDRGDRRLSVLMDSLAAFPCLTFLLGSCRWNPRGLLPHHVFTEVEFPIPGEMERKSLWEQLWAGYRFAGEVDAGGLAGKFRFTPGQIEEALAAAQNLARWRSPRDGRITQQDLHAACRAQASHKLSSMGRKIDPGYSWEDIVLPLDRLDQLREICSQVKHRHVVYGDWGFDKKHPPGGLNALFHGPPGTGKTMAAEIIAGEIGLDLYKIDLSQVVSKYIGETEKNLRQIFREARASCAILFFDEADALFGKRSEVKDAHDRYANVEVAYLLQKMEEYDGIVILATNFRQNMDEAFVRRLHFAVEFPFPDEQDRERIWAGMLPPGAPRNSDLDLAFLARKFRITGGNIKNIVVTAAFLAAEESYPIGMRHMVRATRRELQKMGKPCARDDFGEYYEMLE